eukprot:534248_1
MLPIQLPSNLRFCTPILNVPGNLQHLRDAFQDTDAARQHPSNINARQRFTMKIDNVDKICGPGKIRYWSNLLIHHDQWIDDGKILNRSTFDVFWKAIRGMREDGVMCWETWSDILEGDEAGWIHLHKTVWQTPQKYIDIMENKGVPFWLQYYKQNLVNGRNADDVRLVEPKKRKRKRESLEYMGIPPHDVLGGLSAKKQKVNPTNSNIYINPYKQHDHNMYNNHSYNNFYDMVHHNMYNINKFDHGNINNLYNNNKDNMSKYDTNMDSINNLCNDNNKYDTNMINMST